LATAEFWRQIRWLASRSAAECAKSNRLWVRNPQHNSLRFKKVGRLWSVRISRGYRALGLFKDDPIHWFWIGPHNEYERILMK
jgi:hypothetical protein